MFCWTVKREASKELSESCKKMGNLIKGKLLQIMPKLQILPEKVKITLNKNNKRKRLLLLNFPPAAIFDFITSLRCRDCLEQKGNVVTS